MRRDTSSTTAAAQNGAAAFLLSDVATVGEALRQAEQTLGQLDPWFEMSAAGLELNCEPSATPRLDAEVLLAHVLSASRAELLSRLRETLPENARRRFESLVQQRLAYEPVAYLVREKAFYGLRFYVDPRVLIPRPETELLVDRAIEVFAEHSRSQKADLLVADVGTGSACIAVALSLRLPGATVYALERSPDAMAVAQQNVARHHVSESVTLVQSDLLTALHEHVVFDLIVANLPYVAEPEIPQLPATVQRHEPVEAALAAGPEGLDVIRRLLAQAPRYLRRHGVVLLEIGWRQGPAVRRMAQATFPAARIRIWPDLAGRDRVIEINTREGSR
jgi:release factor glutamine methyltransferase